MRRKKEPDRDVFAGGRAFPLFMIKPRSHSGEGDIALHLGMTSDPA